jgi:hypothetical protein
MNISESNTVIALLRHLDGSQVLDETDLASNLLTLAERAFKTLECSVSIDDQALVDTLSQVAQRHADAENYDKDYEDDYPDIEDVPVGGNLL